MTATASMPTRGACLALALFCGATVVFGQDGGSVLRLPAASSGALMLGAANRLVVPDGGSWRLIVAPADTTFSPGAFFRDERGVVAGTQGKGLAIAWGGDPMTFVGRTEGLAGDVVTAVTGDGRRYYVGTDGGLSVREGQVFVSFTPGNSALPGAAVTSLQLDGAGGVWVATRGGGARVRADDVVEPWPSGDGAPPAFVTAMTDWPGVGLTVAAASSLHVLRDGRWFGRSLDFTPTALLAVPDFGLFLAGLNGVSWLGTLDGAPRSVAGDQGVSSLAVAGDQIWLASSAGVRVLGTPRSLGLTPVQAAAPSNAPTAAPSASGSTMVGLLRDGAAVYGYGSDGLFRRDGLGWRRIWPDAVQPPQGVVAAAADGRGTLAVATAAGRIFVGGAAPWRQVTGGPAFDGAVTSMVLTDDGGRLLVLTEGGAVTEIVTR